mmetsp:Transcript_69763/g.145466  ORF Transcript_69763/g.145466 Transcript_69763/m.145466 type:complete len:210 (-) Transcript_69763:269-898(-)
MVPSESRGITNPFMRKESCTDIPGILIIRTLSTLNCLTSFGRIWIHALATRGAKNGSNPHCFAPMALSSASETCPSSLAFSHFFHLQVVDELQDGLDGLRIPGNDIRTVQPLTQHILGVLQKGASKNNNQVRSIADFFLLSFGRHRHKLCRWVNDLHFLDNRCSIVGHEDLVEVVDDHLVHAIGSDGCAGDRRQLFARFNVLENSLINA